MIPMTDLKKEYQSIKAEIDAAISSVLNDTSFILGPQVKAFEERLAEYLEVKFCAGVASGTDALVLSLLAVGVKSGDEVITTPFTFIATAEAIIRVGAKPVFCDIDPKTFNIDARKIPGKITARTKAIIPVHLYGLPCDMDGILRLAKEKNLKIVEDCAQALGSEYKGKKSGSIGDAGAFSFFPAKTLGCYGDGGAVAVNDEVTANNLRVLRNHGSGDKYNYLRHGFNSRLDTLQAAVLAVKLKYIDRWIQARKKNAGYYAGYLGGIKDIILPSGTDYAEHTFNYFVIRVRQGRKGLQDRLKKKGIASAVHYPLCLHLQEVYRDLGHKRGDFPEAEKAQDEVLSLPMFPLLTKDEIREVSSEIKEAFA